MVSISDLPTEILLNILRRLRPRQLIRCRRVCSRWRDVVDSLTDEDFWQKRCRRRFPSNYREARYKCDPSLSWHELYKSLRLWTKLKDVDQENWMQICSYCEKDIGVCSVSAIEGSLGVHEQYKVLYYNGKGELIRTLDTEWEQLDFRETDSLLVYHINVTPRWTSTLSELIIIKKTNGKPNLDSKVLIENIHQFEIVGEDIYYDKYTPRNEYGERESMIQIFVCKAEDNYESALVGEMDYEAIAFGCSRGTLNIVLYSNDVYTLENNKFVLKDNLNFKTAVYILKTYNFLYGDELQHELSDEVGFLVSAFYFYGDITFLGGGDGVLRVYNTKELLFLPTAKPVCQFDLAERLKPTTTFGKGITGIDVIEKENGHIILVSLRTGAFSIELLHSSNRRSPRLKNQRLMFTKSVEINETEKKKIKLVG